MTPKEFRRWGRAVVDWIADYQERVESLPVLAQVQPGQVMEGMLPFPPSQGEPFDAIMADVDELIVPSLTP